MLTITLIALVAGFIRTRNQQQPVQEVSMDEPIKWGHIMGIIYTLWPWGLTIIILERELEVAWRKHGGQK